MKLHYLLPVATLAALTACGSKSNEGAATDKDTTATPALVNEPYAESSLSNNDTVSLAGDLYHVNVSRSADKSLPVVTDELGTRFYDNRVRVAVRRSNGDMVFEREFTKADFQPHLSDKENAVMVLLGMAYDASRSTPTSLCFGAAVGQPGIDEGPAFVVRLSLDGNDVKIARDNNQDTTGAEAASAASL